MHKMVSILTMSLLAVLVVNDAAAGNAVPSIAGRQITSGAGYKFPQVPKEAEDAYFRAYDVIQVLKQRQDRAAGSPEWDVVVKRLMEAQAIAPTAPRILQDLGLAHELRGRCLAAAAWYKAAYYAIEKIDPGSSQLDENAKRIKVMTETAESQIELALTFAKGEIPNIHATRLPGNWLFDKGLVVFMSLLVAPVRFGPLKVQLPNGQMINNPDLFFEDGTAKPAYYAAKELERYLIVLRLSIGDPSAIAEAEAHALYGSTPGSSSEKLGIVNIRNNASMACIQAFVAAKAWSDIEQLADEAIRWNDSDPYKAGIFEVSEIRELKQQAIENSRQESGDKLGRWLALAEELSMADDELYFQSKIGKLRETAANRRVDLQGHFTEQNDIILETVAQVVGPIGHRLLRLRSIAD
jgi:hypothetical protein